MKHLHKHQIDGLLAFLLLAVFTVCVLSVLLTGADVYRRLTTRDRDAYDRRTAIQYVAAKVRQADRSASVSLTQFGDGDALVLTQDIDGQAYLTRIYCHEGWFRELFSSTSGEFFPSDGEKVLKATGLDLSLEDGLLTVAITDSQGSETALSLSLRGGEGAVQ